MREVVQRVRFPPFVRLVILVDVPCLRARDAVSIDFGARSNAELLVARGELKLGGVPLELSFDVRNIFGRDNFEFQEFNGNRIEINTFEVGTSFNFGLKASF